MMSPPLLVAVIDPPIVAVPKSKAPALDTVKSFSLTIVPRVRDPISAKLIEPPEADTTPPKSLFGLSRTKF